MSKRLLTAAFLFLILTASATLTYHKTQQHNVKNTNSINAFCYEGSKFENGLYCDIKKGVIPLSEKGEEVLLNGG